MVRWAWWDWCLSLGLLLPSLLWHCRLGHLTRINPSPIWPIMCSVGLLSQSVCDTRARSRTSISAVNTQIFTGLWLASPWLVIRALTRDSTVATREFDYRSSRLCYWDGWSSSGGQTTLVFHQATQANSASYPQENEHQPKGGDALRLGSKGRYGSVHWWINAWVACKTVWSIFNTWAP